MAAYLDTSTTAEITIELGRHGGVRGLRGVGAAFGCARSRRELVAARAAAYRGAAEIQLARAFPAQAPRGRRGRLRFVSGRAASNRIGRDRAPVWCGHPHHRRCDCRHLVTGRVGHPHAARGNCACPRRYERHLARHRAQQDIGRDSPRIRIGRRDWRHPAAGPIFAEIRAAAHRCAADNRSDPPRSHGSAGRDDAERCVANVPGISLQAARAAARRTRLATCSTCAASAPTTVCSSTV